MRLVSSWLIIIFSLIAVPATAEPNRIANYLMNDPVSMMDWGLYRIKDDLRDVKVNGVLVDFFVTYYWKQNRIQIIGTSTLPGTKASAERFCVDVVKEIKQRLLVDPNTGQPNRVLGSNHSILATYFLHDGYERNDAPSDLGQTLDSMTTIIGSITFNENKNKSVSCESALRDSRIMVEQKPVPEQ